LDNTFGIHTNSIHCKGLNENKGFFLRIKNFELLNATEGYSTNVILLSSQFLLGVTIVVPRPGSQKPSYATPYN
jgi:hypothetical protein